MKDSTPPRRPAKRINPPANGVREVKFYGTAACEAIFARRRQDIVRIYLQKGLIPRFSELLRWAASERRAYHLVEAEELERLTESVHHQGICLLARERLPLRFEEFQERISRSHGADLVVYLDGVENPHNLGAILRTCAHFGVAHLLGAEGRLPRLSPSACRIAEGGAESVELVLLSSPLKQLRQLKRAGYALATTQAHHGKPLFGYAFPERTLIIMGAEVEGVSEPVTSAADVHLCIPGSGQVESLNVGVAFAVVAGEFYRQHCTG